MHLPCLKCLCVNDTNYCLSAVNLLLTVDENVIAGFHYFLLIAISHKNIKEGKSAQMI